MTIPKNLSAAYIEAQDEPELTDKIHHKKKIAKALKKLEIKSLSFLCIHCKFQVITRLVRILLNSFLASF